MTIFDYYLTMVNYFFRPDSSHQTSSRAIRFASSVKLIMLLLFIVGGVLPARGQFCDCPERPACGVCQGGLTRLTLRLNSVFPLLITAFDQGGQIFSRIVLPGGTFTFTGSKPNEKFLGPDISLWIAGSPSVNIGTG